MRQMNVTKPSDMMTKAKALPNRWPEVAREGAASAPDPAGVCGTGTAPGAASRTEGSAGSSNGRSGQARRPGAFVDSLGSERPFALDELARNVIGDRDDDPLHPLALGDQEASVERILEETIGPAVAVHLDECDHIQKKARVLARRERQIEQIDARERLTHHGLELGLE